MPGLIEVISHIDVAKLTVHLDAANGTVKVDASLNPRDLLGDFGKLLDGGGLAKANPEELIKSLSGIAGEVGKLAQLPSPELFTGVASEFERLVKLLENAASQLGGDGSILDRLTGSAGGFEKILTDLVERVTDVLPLHLPESLTGLFQTLEGLAHGGITDPRHAAGMLSQFLIGLDLDALTAPSAHFDQFVTAIRGAGGDLGGLPLDIEKLTVKVRNVSAMLLAQEIDVPAAQAALTEVRAAFDLLLNHTLAGAVAKLTQDLGALDTGAFAAKLHSLLAAVPAAGPGTKFDWEKDLLAPIRVAVTMLDQLTPAALDAMFADVTSVFADAAANAGLPDLLSSIDDLFDLIIQELERVPLRKLRDELINAMIGLESKIRSIPGLEAPHLFGEEIKKVEDAIDKIDTSAIQSKVAEFASKIDGIAKQFPIQEVKTEIQGLIGSVKGALDQIQPVLDDLGKQLDDVGKQLESIDFNAAGQTAIGLIHEIRGNIESALGGSDIPEPAKMAIGAAADAVKGLNVTVDISKPFNDAMDKIDPKIVLAPIDPLLAKVREVLEKVSPKSVIELLDKPFQELMKELEKVKPTALLAGLSADFSQFTDLVGKLDPRNLVAPVQAEFDKAIAVVRKALDPAPLFAPLHLAYQKLQQLLDLIDLEKLFGKLFDSLSGLPGKVVDTVQSSAAKKAPGAAPATVGDAAVFHFGDILRPLIGIIDQVKRVVTKAAAGVIGEALDFLQAPIAMLARLAHGGHQLLIDIGQELEDRMAAVDLFANTGPAVELRAALMELQLISAEISGDAQATLGPLTVSLDLNAGAKALDGPLNGLQAQSQKVHEGIGLTDLIVALNRLDDELADIVPLPLRDGSLPAEAAARIGALFDFLNLEPLAEELDTLGDQIQAKFLELAQDIARNIIGIWNRILELALPISPLGVIDKVQKGMLRVRAEFAVLDPTPIQAEVGRLIDVALSLLDNYSPQALVADLGGIVDSVKAKLGVLDPVKLLGQLDPVGKVIDSLQELKPSIVLAPLLEDAKGITEALEKLSDVPIGDALIKAAAALKAELEVVVQGVEQELQGLLDYLENLSGGGASVSVSVG